MGKWELVHDQLDKIEAWAREGYTEKEIFQMLNISNVTFYKFKKEKPELQEALKRGYEFSLPKVVPALYKAALGYEYEEVTEELDKKGNLRVTKKVRKYAQPNVSAIMNILKNKFPAEWAMAEKVDVNVSSTSKLENLSDDELHKLIDSISDDEEGGV